MKKTITVGELIQILNEREYDPDARILIMPNKKSIVGYTINDIEASGQCEEVYFYLEESE